ncbi:MAG: PEGA domain-containing protein [Bacteroidales bacterium]
MNIRKNLRRVAVWCFAIFTLTGCELLDRPEQIPAFVHIPEITLIDNSAVNAGSLSSKIVDAWVYIDDQLIGAFELPCTFPVLMEGEHRITVYAGIYMNGVKTTRVYYPFYTGFEKNITLVPDSIITVQPVVAYSSVVKLPFHENFELGGVMLEDGTKSLTSLFKTSDSAEVFEGNFSGKVVLNDTDSVFQAVSIQSYQLPTAGGNVFVELNYKSEADIIIGIYAIKASQIIAHEVAGVLPKNEWNKIYINLTPAVFRENDALSFKIFFGSLLPSGKSEATVLIDNIKLLHF